MNDRLARPETAASLRIGQLFDAQQQAFAANPYPSLDERRKNLRALKQQLQRYQDLLAEAISEDFGFRAPAEIEDAGHPGQHAGDQPRAVAPQRWMKPSRRATELLFLSQQPARQLPAQGRGGRHRPWNFPLYLALGPLAAALAAGNRVMIKMPELHAARPTRVLRSMLAEGFGEDQVALVGEELADPQAFTSLPFNHIVFTGSPAVGRIVMRAAADNLTPVTLELGGKSPAVVLARLTRARSGHPHHARQGHQQRTDLRLARLRAGAARPGRARSPQRCRSLRSASSARAR